MKKYIVIFSTALIICIGVFIWGFQHAQARAATDTFVEYQYQKSFYNLVQSMENLSVLTSKAQVSNSIANSISLYSDIWWQANFATENLSNLSLTHNTLSRTATFLNQLADFAYTIQKKLADNTLPSQEDLATMKELNKEIIEVCNDLHQLETKINAGEIKLYDKKVASKKMEEDTADATLQGSFDKMNEKAMDYPTLIYDGPFSDHMENQKPKDLTGNKISETEADKIAKEISALANNGEEISLERAKEITAKATIPVYGFTKDDEDGYCQIDISETGGHLVLLLNSRQPQEAKIDQAKAIQLANEFLTKVGYENMASTYISKQENALTIAFAYKQDDITIYPDQIKVKIALDNGQILGCEATSYLMNHTNRTLAAPTLTMSEAQAMISTNLAIDNKSLVLIPTKSGGEKLCYEFKGMHDENIYFVYINADTGKEEEILQLIETENGQLTM